MTTPARSTRTMSQPWPLLPLGDDAYRAMADETKHRIAWDRIVQDDDDTPGAEPWKWLENVRNFSLYTKQRDGFRVLSTGVVKGSVHEVATLLVATSQQAFTQQLAALHDTQFKHATYVADIAGDSSTSRRTSNDDKEPEHERDADAPRRQLSVRSVVFTTSGWRRRDDEWCFLEETQHDVVANRFEKLLTTLPPQHARSATADRSFTFSEPTRLRNAIAGYLVVPPDASDTMAKLHSGCVRVHFYAEVPSPVTRSRFGNFARPTTKRDGATKAQQSRLLQLAKDCDRLAHLVRRRRLGMQVLVDQRRVLPPLNALCVKCDKSLLVAKLCRVCGHNVCSDCSDKYERETHGRSYGGISMATGRGVMIKRLETIRVCDPCLDRVERGEYGSMSDQALAGPAVVPDPVRKDGSQASAATDLKLLLQNALRETQSPQRKSAVLNVMRYVLNQEERVEDTMQSQTDSISSERTPTLLAEPQPLDDEALRALDGLVLHNTPHSDITLADHDGRAYTLTPDYETGYTATSNETQRLEALEDLQVLTAAPCDELDIICAMAAKEVGVFASIVSIVTQDEMRVVAANDPSFKSITAERAHSFCTHTIMDDKPLIIPHPEADVRVSYTKVATALGARFYCGFPLVTDGDKVLGTLCCLDQQPHELTESQYAAMQRLALTAAKIIKVRGDQQRRVSRAASASASASASVAASAPASC